MLQLLHRRRRRAWRRFLKLNAALVGLEAKERTGAEEAVTAEAFAADDALEEERPVAVLDLAKRGHRGERVADELPVDRNQAVVAGQVQEFVEGRAVTH